MTRDPILTGELREEIVSGFERRLHAQGNPILDSSATRELVLHEVRSLLDDVINCCLMGVGDVVDIVRVAPPSAAEPGAGCRREAGHTAAASLGAANALFEAALPVMLRAFSEAGLPEAGGNAALLLHRVILRSIASSLASSTALILGSIRAAHRAELSRLARELHDRTAHTICVALQNLELYELHAPADAAHAQEKLDRARDAMAQALDSVRHFFGELRSTVRPDELEQALTDYLAANAGSDVLSTVKVSGEIATLPADICEELYLVLREAIRNALVHSGATRLDIVLCVTESQFHARVADTGRGFPVEEAIQARTGIGLSSMRERVELLGGTLVVSSAPGAGATVEMSVPLGPVRP